MSKIVFAFGRFQPPTIGHELLINSVKKTATDNNAEHVIYVSKTQDKKKNPLTVLQKIQYLNKMFPDTNFVACDESVRTPIEAIKTLNETYTDLVMIAGSDRVPTFQTLLTTYNHREYEYDSISVVSSGERDPDSVTVSGASGTRMRASALTKDIVEFRKGIPSTLSDFDTRQLLTDVRTAMCA